MEGGLGAVIAGERCFPADEAAPGRDLSYSDLDWDAIGGTAGSLMGTHLYLCLTSSWPCLRRSCELVDMTLALAGAKNVEGGGAFCTLLGAP